MLNTLKHYLISLGLIFVCLMAGTAVQHWLGLAIPGSILGMLLLFALMATGLIPAAWVKPGASLFIRYMIVLFVPISVGLMVHLDMLVDNIWIIVASAIGGTTMVMVCLGLLLDRLLKRGEKSCG